MKFNEVLNKYLNLIGCTSKDLAKNANLSESIISRYKNSNRIPSEENLNKISKSLESLSNQEYKSSDILKEFHDTSNISTIDFNNVRNNLNIIIDELKINVSELAKSLNFDPSYLSRIRSGNRIPSNKDEFLDAISSYILKKYNNEQSQNIIANLIGTTPQEINSYNFKKWLSLNTCKEDNKIENFLQKLDEFNLDDYIKAIKFDKLKIPTIPFYKAKSKNYYGLEEMKQGELDFFKATVLAKAKDDIFMCSDMPMEDMAKDLEFGKKWMFGIAASLKKGLHLNIIHNLDRPFNEMMLGLESWVPIYMTGQISPYYFKDNNTTIYRHLNYVSKVAALTGECIKGNHSQGKYYLTTNQKEINYYQTKADLLLKKANSLMDIYRENDIDKFKIFLDKKYTCPGNRTRIIATLPLFTIKDEDLEVILTRNNINQEDKEKILNYKKEEEKVITTLLKENLISDTIYKFTKEEFEKDKVFLSLENIFYNKLTYTYDEYLKHYNATINFSKHNQNYKINKTNRQVFKNISITIFEDDYVIVTKSSNPVIHFVINHPKLVVAIKNFEAPVNEE